MLAINLKNARVLTNLFYKRFKKRSYKQDFIKSIFTVKVAFRKSIPNLGSGTPTQSEFDYIQWRDKLASPHSDGFLTVTSLAPKRKVPQKRQEDFPAAGHYFPGGRPLNSSFADNYSHPFLRKFYPRPEASGSIVHFYRTVSGDVVSVNGILVDRNIDEYPGTKRRNFDSNENFDKCSSQKFFTGMGSDRYFKEAILKGKQKPNFHTPNRPRPDEKRAWFVIIAAFFHCLTVLQRNPSNTIVCHVDDR